MRTKRLETLAGEASSAQVSSPQRCAGEAGVEAAAARKAGAAASLSACLQTVDSAEGRRRVTEYLKALPYPHYEPDPSSSARLIRITADGRRTIVRLPRLRRRAVKTVNMANK
jgi:hypothetical protein